MESYELTLPYPPSNNHHKQMRQGGKISKRTGKPIPIFFLPSETKNYHIDVAWRFKTQKGKYFEKCRLHVEIDVYPPTGKRGFYLDNVPKVVLDALQKAGAYKNDSQIDYLLITRKDKYPCGQLKVRIAVIG